MTTTPRYPGKTSEYGGGDARNYRTPDGSLRPLSTTERAQLLRREGINDSAGPTDLEEPYEYGDRVG